jgi:VWFA-related protein
MAAPSRSGLAVALCLILAALAPSLSAQAPPTPDGFSEQVDVNVINVDVYVTDKNGRPVTGLRQQDFELRQDGKRVEITNFEAPSQTSPAVQGEPLRPTGDAGNAGAAMSATPAPAAPPVAVLDPLHLVIYVDNLNIEPAHRARAVGQIREYLSRELSPGSRAMVVTYDVGGLHVRQPFTSDRAVLARALDEVTRLATRGGEDERARRTALEAVYTIQAEAMSLYNQSTKGEQEGEETPLDVPCSLRIAEPVKSYSEAARAEVLRTIASLKLFVNSLSGLPGRKVLLHVSDGISVTPGEELFQVLQELCGGGGASSGVSISMINDDAAQPMDARSFGARAYQASQAMADAQHYSTASEWTELAAHANANRVTLYTLQASGLETSPAASAEHQGGGREQMLRLGSVLNIDANNRRDSLNVLASDTGGRAIFDANDLTPELGRIQEDLETYYSLGFAPRRFGDGREHRLEVKVKRADLRVRYRRSYRDKSPLERAADRTLAALFYGTEENPLEVALEIGEIVPASQGGGYTVPVRLHIPLRKLLFQQTEESYEGKLRLLVATQSGAGATSKVRQVLVPIKVPKDKALIAFGQDYVYELTLTMGPGEQRVAVAVRDDGTAQTSFLARGLHVGSSDSAVRGQF